MDENKKLDLNDYPNCLNEIIKYMDWLEGTDEDKKAFLEAFVAKVTMA